MSDKLQEYHPNGEDRQDSYGSILQRYQFIEYLNKEIDNLQDEIKRPGWTNYAIIISIAALAWTLIYCFETGGYSLRNIAFLILGFSLFWDLIKFLVIIPKSPRLELKLKRRFINSNFLSSNRLPLLLSFCQYGFFLFVSLKLSRDLGTFTMIFTSVFISLFLFALLLGIFLVFFKFPMPMSPPRKKLNLAINVIIILAFLVIAFLYLGFSLTSPSTSVITDIRLALPIVAIFYLLVTLIRVPKGKLILDSLVMTRRELAVDDIHLDTAKVYTDVALTGLRTSDVLEEYLADVLSLYHEATTGLSEVSSYLKDVEILHTEKQDEQVEQATLVRPLIETTLKLVTKAMYIINTSIPKALKRLNYRVIWVSAQGGEPGTIDEIDRKLGNTQKDLTKQINTVANRLKALMELDHPN